MESPRTRATNSSEQQKDASPILLLSLAHRLLALLTDSARGGALSIYGYAVLRTAKGTIFSGCQRPVQNYGTKCTQSPVPGT